MVQYYRDLWARWSNILAPLTSLVGECGQTKSTRAKGTKKVPWHWDEVHQRAFDHVKATIAKNVVLAYPDFSKVDIQPPGTNLYFKYEFVPATLATAVVKTQQPT
jgi:hypothetical protein